jgi:hypothetical protein
VSYSNRREEEIVVKTARSYTIDGEAMMEITTTKGSGFAYLVQGGMESIVDGETLILETRGASAITGLRYPGEDWFFHRSDEELETAYREMAASFRRRNEELLKESREDWAAREAALPDDLRARLEFFRERGGYEFEVEGWGYELTVCELAALYRQAGVDDEGAIIESLEVDAYAGLHGTTGNQHAVAKLIVEASNPLRPDRMEPKEIPGALTPLGVARDYGPRNPSED